MNSDVKDQIENTIKSKRVTLFMKGTPAFPQCGFSQQTVQILQHYGVDFGSVNVLEDPAIREGIKEFSDWPTIPQLYVDGEFIGGCDILMEMHGNGQLGEILGTAETDPTSTPTS
jgi:monothiol glutaredoxin